MTKTLEHHLCIVRNFFCICLQRALDLAKDGKKDEARELFKLFENMELLDLLGHPEFGVLAKGEKGRLTVEMNALMRSCHPHDVPDYRTDLQAIRGELEKISDYLGVNEHEAVAGLPAGVVRIDFHGRSPMFS